MTPTETLAAARLSPVGPYVPARPEWLEGWTGPVEWLDTFRYTGGRWVVSAYGAGGMANGAPVEHILLDLRRPEVRDLLVRCGCPSWARDCAPAVWAWANGVEGADVLGGYVPSELLVGGRPQLWRRAAVCGLPLSVLVASDGWSISRNGRHAYNLADYVARGRETGADGRACADLAALRAGCVLEEADGWYVPLVGGGVGGGVGWWPKNLEATP